MVKKILFSFFLMMSMIGFSQKKSIENVYATPNPFNTKTTFIFKSSEKQTLLLRVKNILGKTVYQKVIITKKGTNKIPFSKNNLLPGLYIYSLTNQKESVAKRLVIR